VQKFSQQIGFIDKLTAEIISAAFSLKNKTTGEPVVLCILV